MWASMSAGSIFDGSQPCRLVASHRKNTRPKYSSQKAFFVPRDTTCPPRTSVVPTFRSVRQGRKGKRPAKTLPPPPTPKKGCICRDPQGNEHSACWALYLLPYPVLWWEAFNFERQNLIHVDYNIEFSILFDVDMIEVTSDLLHLDRSDRIQQIFHLSNTVILKPFGFPFMASIFTSLIVVTYQ